MFSCACVVLYICLSVTGVHAANLYTLQIYTTGAHSLNFGKDGLRTDENEPLKTKNI